MLRVGYPAVLQDAALLRDFPADVEMVPLADGLDQIMEIDVWIPDPYPTRALRMADHARQTANPRTRRYCHDATKGMARFCCLVGESVDARYAELFRRDCS